MSRLLVVCLLAATGAQAQEASVGLSVPITVSADLMAAHWLPSGSKREVWNQYLGARALFMPTLRLPKGWFAYGAVQVKYGPFFWYDIFSDVHNIETSVLQAYAGHESRFGSVNVVVKAGKLASAFGSFPLRYNDRENPLIDVPLSYGSSVRLGSDRVIPVTLYGLNGAEMDVTTRRTDLRFQVTNSSPSNPQSLLSGDQHAQWTAGGGYTLSNGLRIGVSAFRGSWFSAAGTMPSSLVSAAGIDAQWSRGTWNLSAEAQRFRYSLANSQLPSPVYAYLEAKKILNPRFYGAIRFGDLHMPVKGNPPGGQLLPYGSSFEFAVGHRPNHWQLIKLTYEWVRPADSSHADYSVLRAQLSTDLPAFSRAR